MTLPPNSSPTTGPSRDVFGGPWVGVLAFVVVAVLLGWGLISLFQMQLQRTTHELSRGELDHGFDPAAVYTLERDLLIGVTSNGQRAVFPGRDDLPRGVPNRRAMPTAQELRAAASGGGGDAYPDLLGVVDRGTRVRFNHVVEDMDNPQTQILVWVVLLDGPFAGDTPVLGMHLESADAVADSGGKRYLPRADLFEAKNDPLQSPAPTP